MQFSIPPYGVPDKLDGIWIRAEDSTLPHPVLFRLGWGEDGQLVATGLIIEAVGELTASQLRLPLARILDEFAAAVEAKPALNKRLYTELAGHPEFANDKSFQLSSFGSEARVADYIAVPQDPAKRYSPVPRAGRTGRTDDFYRTFAKKYADAKRLHPRAPIRALMKEMGYSEKQIHRFRRIAEDKKFIKTTKED